MLKAIKVLLLFFVVFLLLGFFFLFVGFKINSISFGNVSISQFYIKLDKKLILTIDNIILNDRKSKTTSTFEEIKKDIQFFPTLLKYFERIDIENIAIADNRFTVKLEDNYLFLDNKYINIATSFEHSSNNSNLDLYSLYLKEHDVLFDGKINIDYNNEKITYDGNYFIADIIGNLKVESNKQKVEFYTNSNSFKNLHFLKTFLTDIDEVAKSWMYDNVKGPIKLNEFSGVYNLTKNMIEEDSLNGTATIDKGQIKFHKDVEPIMTQKIDVAFINGNLLFNLDKPRYKNIKIDGSYVKIENLVSQKKGKVIVSIKMKQRLDENVQSILKAFDIQIPLIQNDGITNANLILDIPYIDPMKTTGIFDIENSNITIADNFDFYSKSANVELDGSIVKIRNADFKHKDMINANVDLDIDTNTLKAKGKADIKSILIKSDDESIINILDTNSAINLDFNDDINIDLLDLEAYLSIDENLNIDLKNLSKLKSYSNLLSQNNIDNGTLNLVVKDFENIDFKGNVTGENLQLYSIDEYEENKIKKLYLDGNIKDSILNMHVNDVILDNNDSFYNISNADVEIVKGDINFKADLFNLDIPLKKDNELIKELSVYGELKSNNDLKINSKDDTIVYKSINNEEYFNVFLDGYDVLINTNTKEKDEDQNIKKYKINATNSNLVINDKYKFLSKKLDAKLDENIVLDLKYNNTKIRFEDVNNINKIFASNLTDTYLNTMIDKDIFSGGIMDLSVTGKDYELQGNIKLNNSRIKDLAFINNLITFVNTSPALLNPLLAIPSVIDMINNDGFNLNGYRINEGEVEFKYSPINDKILVTDLKAIGNSVDFEGSGIIDLKTDTLDMNLNLIFLKGYSKMVKYLPVVNYLLLGENKRIETIVKVEGLISDPKVETNFLKEGLNAPLDFGKRILNTPKNLYDSIIGNEEEK